MAWTWSDSEIAALLARGGGGDKIIQRQLHGQLGMQFSMGQLGTSAQAETEHNYKQCHKKP